eukprot:1835882-Pyramimonas_sp.AAC.1
MKQHWLEPKRQRMALARIHDAQQDQSATLTVLYRVRRRVPHASCSRLYPPYSLPPLRARMRSTTEGLWERGPDDTWDVLGERSRRRESRQFH